MKILVIGGMHGNEPLGIRLVEMFQSEPVEDVDSVLANKEAIELNLRFVKQDLNRSFPGNICSKIYEQKRAAYLLNRCKEYDLVFDFHNTHCSGNDCAFVGEFADKNLYNISAYFGLKRVIVADYQCINKYAPNCISVEISLNSKMMNPKTWYEGISRLSKIDTILFNGKVEKYRFVYRMTLEDRDRLNLARRNLKAFKPISKKLANTMKVKSPAYPIFVGDKFTPYNYGGLLNKLGH